MTLFSRIAAHHNTGYLVPSLTARYERDSVPNLLATHGVFVQGECTCGEYNSMKGRCNR